jgi:Tol biopolymer transport system component
MSKPVELNPEFTLAERIDAPHRFAYKSAFEVILRSVDGTSVEALFHDKGRSLNAPLAWAPDGSTLYHAYDQIYAIDPRTKAARPLTHSPERFCVNHHLHSSPDGRRVVFFRYPNRWPAPAGCSQAWCGMEADGSGQYELPNHSPSPLFCPEYFWWHWSKDRARCLLWKEEVPSAHQVRVWAMDAAGGSRVALARFLSCPGLGFDLSPDGKNILFGYNHDDGEGGLGEYAGLFLRPLPGGADALVHERGTYPAWSPRGDRFAYRAGAALWVYETTTGKQTKVVAIPGAERPGPLRFGLDERSRPAWSPDGRFVAFWLHREVRPFTFHADGSVAQAGAYENRTGLVDLQDHRVFILGDGYWEHVSWQPGDV